ncbi:hypothetical protein [Microbacterium phyllosphaerae]|uniref:hypothetical protein n=1 Tax=Microbacterium phyllosphaerae TaxID=124798 RepID=UPI002167FB16|nr:hypothetical protein [Microbacterium phyllosphaerae]
MNKYSGYNVLEVAVTVSSAIWLTPHLQTTYPDIPDWVWGLGTPAAAAFAVFFASLLLWQKATVEATWKEGVGPTQNDIIAKLDPTTKVSPFYEIGFGGEPKGGLTRLLMWWLRRKNLRLTVDIPGAPITTTVEDSSKDLNRVNLARPDYRKGFSIRVVEAPNPHTWMLAVIYFDAETVLNQRTFVVKYTAIADGWWPNLLAKLVGVTSPTNTITFH